MYYERNRVARIIHSLSEVAYTCTSAPIGLRHPSRLRPLSSPPPEVQGLEFKPRRPRPTHRK